MTAPNELERDICERCLKGKVSAVYVDTMYSHEGESVSFKDEFMRCDNCGREFYTTEQSMARSRAITTALRKQQGFMTGEEIRAARLAYDLSLPEFEKALGVGKNTVGRWERGTVPPTGAANFGLWVAVNAPDVFEKWAQHRGIEIKKRQREITAEASTSQAPSKPILTLLQGGRAVAASTETRVRSTDKQEGTAVAAGDLLS